MGSPLARNGRSPLVKLKTRKQLMGIGVARNLTWKGVCYGRKAGKWGGVIGEGSEAHPDQLEGVEERCKLRQRGFGTEPRPQMHFGRPKRMQVPISD